jgi:hypothetical protein
VPPKEDTMSGETLETRGLVACEGSFDLKVAAEPLQGFQLRK